MRHKCKRRHTVEKKGEKNKERKLKRLGKDHPSPSGGLPVRHNVPQVAKVGENFCQRILILIYWF